MILTTIGPVVIYIIYNKKKIKIKIKIKIIIKIKIKIVLLIIKHLLFSSSLKAD